MTDHEHDDDHGDDEVDPFIEKMGEIFRSKADEVESAARKVGLYIQDAALVKAPIPGMEAAMPAMVANFSVGDVAWSDRVQNPAQDSTEAEFRKMAVQTEKERFEEKRAELERRLAEGKGIFDEDAED